MSRVLANLLVNALRRTPADGTVAKAAHRFAKRLDIGNASKTVVDCDFGHVCICVYGDVLAAAQCDRGTDLEQVMADLQELVAGALHSVGESHE